MSKNNSFVIYKNGGEHGRMYFTGTKWGGRGYANQLRPAQRFETLAEAADALHWLDNGLVAPQGHFIQKL